jgi:hypothetical protein
MQTTRGAHRCPRARERFTSHSRIPSSCNTFLSRTKCVRHAQRLQPRSWCSAALSSDRDSQLISALESLHDMIVEGSAPDAIDVQVAVVAELSRELGKNKVRGRLRT